jgi:RHS repeat-associated protein
VFFHDGEIIKEYGTGNRMVSFNGEEIRYDEDGNMTHGPLGDGFAGFEYDSLNRLVKAGNTGYVYDGEGTRVAQTVNGQRTTYVTDTNTGLSKLLMKRNPDGSTTYYVYGLGLISQETVSAGGVQGTQGEYRVFHTDYRGSTAVLTALDGAVTDRIAYDPDGNIIGREGNTETVFLFVGQFGIQADSNGLYYMRNRYYSPQMGRFINQDPIKDGGNWYAYAGGNPIRYIDPLGLAAVDAEDWFNKRYAHISRTYKNTFGAYEWDATTNTASISIVAHGYLYFAIFDPCGDSFASLIDGRLHVDEQILWQYFGLAIDPALIHTPFKDSIFQGVAIGVGIKVIPIVARSTPYLIPFVNKIVDKLKSFTNKGLDKVDPNKLNHLFGKGEHNFNSLLRSFEGDQAKAYHAIQNAAQNYVVRHNVTGIINASNQITVNVSGHNVVVRGAVIDGTMRIGTAFIPGG